MSLLPYPVNTAFNCLSTYSAGEHFIREICKSNDTHSDSKKQSNKQRNKNKNKREREREI